LSARAPRDYNRPRSLEASDAAADALGPEVLLAAAPWFHAGHLLEGRGAQLAAARPADDECDWCGAAAAPPADAGEIASRGCARCGCARYCGAACAAKAAPLHALNCARLRRLTAPHAALRASFDPGRPMFAYGDGVS
jgi:hypothetical protein